MVETCWSAVWRGDSFSPGVAMLGSILALCWRSVPCTAVLGCPAVGVSAGGVVGMVTWVGMVNVFFWSLIRFVSIQQQQ